MKLRSQPAVNDHVEPGAGAHLWDRASLIAVVAVAGIGAHLGLRWGPVAWRAARDVPLYVVLAVGGVPLVLSLALKLVRRQFGSDLLAGISIVASVLLGEYLAGALVVLMLSGGQALEAVRARSRLLGAAGAGASNAAASRTAASTVRLPRCRSTRSASATS